MCGCVRFVSCVSSVRLNRLRIDNSGGSVSSTALFDIAVMKWYQRKYYVLYNIRKPIINSIY